MYKCVWAYISHEVFTFNVYISLCACVSVWISVFTHGWWMYHYLCLHEQICMSVWVTMGCVSMCLWVSFCVFMCTCDYVYECLCMFLSLYVLMVCVVCVYVYAHVYLCLSLCICLWLYMYGLCMEAGYVFVHVHIYLFGELVGLRESWIKYISEKYKAVLSPFLTMS